MTLTVTMTMTKNDEDNDLLQPSMIGHLSVCFLLIYLLLMSTMI